MKFAKFFLVICTAVIFLPFLVLAAGGLEPAVEILRINKTPNGTELEAEAKWILNNQAVMARLETFDKTKSAPLGKYNFTNGKYKFHLLDIASNSLYRFVVTGKGRVSGGVNFNNISCTVTPSRLSFKTVITAPPSADISKADVWASAFLYGREIAYQDYVSTQDIMSDVYNSATKERIIEFNFSRSDIPVSGKYCFIPFVYDHQKGDVFASNSTDPGTCCDISVVTPNVPTSTTPNIKASCSNATTTIRYDLAIDPFPSPLRASIDYVLFDAITNRTIGSGSTKYEPVATNLPFSKKIAVSATSTNVKVCFSPNLEDSSGQDIQGLPFTCCNTANGLDFSCSGSSATALFGQLRGILDSNSALLGRRLKITAYEKGKDYNSADAKDSQSWVAGGVTMNQLESFGNLKSGTNYCFTALYDDGGTWKPVPGVSTPCCATRALLQDDVDYYVSKGRSCSYLKIINPGKTLKVTPEINNGLFRNLNYRPEDYLSSSRNSKVRYAGSGTFFAWGGSMVQPEGMLMIDGKMLRLYNDGGYSFCQTKNGDFRMGKAQFNIEAEIQEILGANNPYRFLEISQLNSLNTKPMVRMFTAEWNGSVPVASGFVRYVAVDKNNVISAISAQPLAIPAGGNLIVYNNVGLDRFDCVKYPKGCLRVGYHLKFKWNALAGNAVDLADWQANCQSLISGMPTLLSGGKVSPSAASGMRSSHTGERSAIGVIDKNNAVLMVCDGLNATQMAYALLDVGAREAVNLDGSGSAFLYFNPDRKPYSKNFMKGYYDGRELGDIILIKEK